MKWMDEKGRLFGKINIFDLLVILLVLVGVIGIATRLIQREETALNYQKAVSQIEIEDSWEFVANAFSVGDVLYEEGVKLGTVTAVEISPYRSLEQLNDGSSKYVEHKLGYTVKMTLETDQLLVTEEGTSVNTQEWLAGTKHHVSNGFANGTAIIRSLEIEK